MRDEKKRRESGSGDSARRPRVPFPGPGQGWRFPRLTGPPSPCPQLQQAPGLYSALAPWPAPTCHLPDTHMRSTYNKTQVAGGRWQGRGPWREGLSLPHSPSCSPGVWRKLGTPRQSWKFALLLESLPPAAAGGPIASCSGLCGVRRQTIKC